MNQETMALPHRTDQAHGVGATAVTATLVTEPQRLAFLPHHFGEKVATRIESTVQVWMDSLCPHYRGGCWDFFALSNGGAFMAPREAGPYEIRVDGNGFDGQVSAEAAGIIACAFALNSLLWQGHDSLADKHDQLQAYIAWHPDSATIRRALD